MNYSGLVLYLTLALAISFLCSLLEAVILSVSPAYIATLEKAHPKAGDLLKHLKERIDRPLSAILTLNTTAHTVGAAGVGSEVLELWGHKSVAVASAVLTLLILVVSEIIPKTLGAVHWRRLAPATAYIVRALIIGLYPLVVSLEALSRLLSAKGKRMKFSREEMMSAAQIGHSEGTLQAQENRIIQNILRLQNIRAQDILTPRSVLLAFKRENTVGEVVETHQPIRFSRIPACDTDLDDVTGFVHRYKILQAFSEGQGDLTLEELSQPIHAVPETKDVAGILNEFVQRREHIFLVVDEYGGTAGIITLEDAIETLLGVEIVDEFDTVDDMREFARRQGEFRKKQRETNPRT